MSCTRLHLWSSLGQKWWVFEDVGRDGHMLWDVPGINKQAGTYSHDCVMEAVEPGNERVEEGWAVEGDVLGYHTVHWWSWHILLGLCLLQILL